MSYIKSIFALVVVAVSTMALHGCANPQELGKVYCKSLPDKKDASMVSCMAYQQEEPELEGNTPHSEAKLPEKGDSNGSGVTKNVDKTKQGELVGIPRSQLPEACDDMKSLAECCTGVSFLVAAPCIRKKCEEQKPDKPWGECVLKSEKYGTQCKDQSDKAYSECLIEQQRHNASTTPYTEQAPEQLKGQASGGGGGAPTGNTAPSAEY